MASSSQPSPIIPATDSLDAKVAMLRDAFGLQAMASTDDVINHAKEQKISQLADGPGMQHANIDKLLSERAAWADDGML